jgi:xylitol oxidase
MSQSPERLNWAGNYRYAAERIHFRETLEEVRSLVVGARRVHALGSRHSFNDIADTAGDLLSLARFDATVTVNAERRTATVGAGARYGELCAELHRHGYALPNMASLPHISVAGACATATHGSGDGNRCLAASVSGLEMVTADGGLIAFSRERDAEFPGAVVGLGALGVVTRLTLDLEPAFEVRQEVYLDLPFSAVEADLDAVTGSAYSVSLFTDWSEAVFRQVWRKSKVDAAWPGDLLQTGGTSPNPSFARRGTTRRDLSLPDEGSGGNQAANLPTQDLANSSPPCKGGAGGGFFGATAAERPMHPLASMSPVHCTEQMGVVGPWHERLPHFRMEFTPSSGEELQSEYLIPRRHALSALRAMLEVGPRIAPLLQVSEVRTVAADDLWMSPFFEQPCIAIHFTWVKDWPAVREVLPLIERQLAPFEARPHWGKLFKMTGEPLRALIPRLPEFLALAKRLDPGGKFRNAFLDRTLSE